MYCIVGIEKVDYTSKKTGREVKGTKLHLLCAVDEENENVDGQCVESVYVSENVPILGLNVGDSIEILYNKFGQVTQVNIV